MTMFRQRRKRDANRKIDRRKDRLYKEDFGRLSSKKKIFTVINVWCSTRHYFETISVRWNVNGYKLIDWLIDWIVSDPLCPCQCSVLPTSWPPETSASGPLLLPRLLFLLSLLSLLSLLPVLPVLPVLSLSVVLNLFLMQFFFRIFFLCYLLCFVFIIPPNTVRLMRRKLNKNLFSTLLLYKVFFLLQASDPIQALFVEKIQEYSAKSKV